MEKRPSGRGLISLVLAFRYVYGLRHSSLRKLRPPARRRLVTERSERTVEEAEKNRR